EFGTTVIVRAGLTNPGGTRATISAAIIVNRTDPQNDVIEVASTVTAGSAKRLYCCLNASKS
ncbi:MAG: hypothetical protein KGQ89_11020, partial [Verrucomicrobia bacterium]|nr:hypothetical protein [Verrucomicrobiota bacterium]